MPHNDFYDGHYRKGGFRYDLRAERDDLRLIARLADWRAGDRIIEIGAGLGHHAAILADLGYDVTAVEASPEAGTAAADRYPSLDFVVADIAEWEPDRPGHVYARGMSWFHYQLDGVNQHGVDVPAETGRLFDRYVAPGHSFVLQIATDWSGRRPADGRVHMNQPGDYCRLFEPYGTVALTDWSGDPAPARADRGVIVTTRK